MKAKSNIGKGRTKVKPVVVKHVLTQNYLQKPEIYENRPQKQLSEVSGGLSIKKQQTSLSRSGAQARPSAGPAMGPAPSAQVAQQPPWAQSAGAGAPPGV